MEIKKPYTILIVDDNKNNLFSLRTLIKEYINSDVLEADLGEKALLYLYKSNVDLIILDVKMNDMDGFEVALMIKKRRKTRDIPIVFLTASYITDEFRRRGFEVGAVDYLTKPIDEYQLINRINVYLKLIEKERFLNSELEKQVNEKTKELRKAKEEAEAANEAKNLFLANISHELRTPLCILLGTTKIINNYIDNGDDLDATKLSGKVKVQTQNCYRLLRLVNNLIDITKIDSGYLTLNLSLCNIVKLVEDITLSVVEYVGAKDIELIFDTDVEELFICCDLDALERIILNLLSNAFKFTNSGGSIYVNFKSSNDKVWISVKDTGVGIRQENINTIFERFRQVENLMTREHEGSGIGLSLVKNLIELHGGSINIHSSYGEGSEFVVELPIINSMDDNNYSIKKTNFQNNFTERINIEFSDIYI